MAQGEIIVRIIGEGEGDGGQSPITVNNKKITQQVSDKNMMAVYSNLVRDTAKDLYGQAVNEVKYELNKYLTLSDNYQTKQQLTIATNVINKTVSIGRNIATGAAMGGWVGAGLAALASTIELGINIYQNYDQEAIRIRQMNAQLDYSRQRAGYSLTAGSRGENR